MMRAGLAVPGALRAFSAPSERKKRFPGANKGSGAPVGEKTWLPDLVGGELSAQRSRAQLL